MLDYSERRPVSTNRPKRQGMARYFVLTAAASIIAGYGLGMITGWILFKPFRQEVAELRRAVDAASASKPEPGAASPQQVPSAGATDPDLSFFKTLPKGETYIGTGFNQPKPEVSIPRPAGTPPAPVPAAPGAPSVAPLPQHPPAKPPPSAPEQRDGAVREQQAGPPAPKPAATPSATPAVEVDAEQVKKAQPKGKFVVQVASYQSKAEADAVKGRLADAGLPAYIVESTLKDKGTWYRVRVGKHLDQATAAELAIKAGKNAIVVLE